jgi:hypothetical protein
MLGEVGPCLGVERIDESAQLTPKRKRTEGSELARRVQSEQAIRKMRSIHVNEIKLFQLGEGQPERLCFVVVAEYVLGPAATAADLELAHEGCKTASAHS